ncbi:cell cycle progression protein 1 isoform X11 [Scyliorhinus canicula]|uniref:cell cycle progression protein 1 isoform X11 n=1 Tax=Scyliorhinus canicula TaxID=7830 RepID=UPI0018F439CA|nr:cell cycle progression protein 1 isoform X11 [Scyliorhinus canicula]
MNQENTCHYLGVKMSESSSDSESSCGWTIINHEGSDVEVLSSDKGETEGISQPLSDQLDKPMELQAEETGHTQLPVETLNSSVTLAEKEPLSEAPKEKLVDDNTFVGATSDDSDIVTLEPPPVEDLQTVQEEPEVAAEEQINDDELNLGSSSSSQYTFAPPETVSATEGSRDESSSDETSGKSSPTLRRRRIRKKTMSSSETEEKPAEDVEDGEQQQQQQQQHRFNTTLNKCILLALVIAFSMGFGHFYGEFEGDFQDGSQLPLKRGTVQIQEQQKMVKRFHEDELNDVKDDLFQCQKDQAGTEEPLEDIKEKPDMLLTMTELMDKMRKENVQLKEKQAELQIVYFQRNSSPGHHQQFQLWSQKKDLGTERERNATMKPQEWKRKHGRGDDPQFLEGKALAREENIKERHNQDRLEFWFLRPWEVNLRKSQFHKHRTQTCNVHRKISRRKITGFPKIKRTLNPCQNKEKNAHSVHQNFHGTHTIHQKNRKGPSTFIKKKMKRTKYAIKSGSCPKKTTKKSLQSILPKNRKVQKVFQRAPHKKNHNANWRICNSSPKSLKQPNNVCRQKRKQHTPSRKIPRLPKDSCKKAHSASHQAHHVYHKETENRAPKIQTKAGRFLQHPPKKGKRPMSARKAHICPNKPSEALTMTAKKSGKGSRYLAKQIENKLSHSPRKINPSSIIKNPHHIPKKSQKRANGNYQRGLHKQAHKIRQTPHKIRNKNSAKLSR